MVSLLLIDQNVKRPLHVKLAEGQDGRQHHHHMGQRHGWGFFSSQTHAHHKEVRQNHQRHRMMPSCPTPDCIITHPQQLLAVFKASVNTPVPNAHHLGIGVTF